MSERLAFVVMFSLMAVFVVGLTVLAAKTGATPLTLGHSAPSSSRTPPTAHDQANSGEPGGRHR